MGSFIALVFCKKKSFCVYCFDFQEITCYDRDGKEVKRVTSTDDAEVEDNENGGTTGDGGSQNQGSGENTNPTNPGGNGGDDEEEGGQN